MRTFVHRFLAIIGLVALVSCGGARIFFASDGIVTSSWGGFVSSPASQFFVLQPGQTLIIIVQQSPSFFFPPPIFFGNFTGANPNLGTFCPAVGTIGSTLVTTGGSFIQIVFTPVAFGNCVFPVFLGAGGTATFEVQVSASGTNVHIRRHP